MTEEFGSSQLFWESTRRYYGNERLVARFVLADRYSSSSYFPVPLAPFISTDIGVGATRPT